MLATLAGKNQRLRRCAMCDPQIKSGDGPCDTCSEWAKDILDQTDVKKLRAEACWWMSLAMVAINSRGDG